MQFLKADTAATVLIGPFVDKGDGVTPETGVTLGGADSAELMKHDGTTFVDISGRTFTHKEGGMYTLALTTGDTDTEGRLTVFVRDDDVCLPVWENYMVVSANVFDSLFAAAGTDRLEVDVQEGVAPVGTAMRGTDSASTHTAAQAGTDAAGKVLSTPANKLVTDGSGRVTVGTNADKTAYKLASDGLDSVATTAPSGVASNFREMIVALWRRFFKKATMTSTQLKTYADNDTSVLTTQTLSDDGTTQTQGKAT